MWIITDGSVVALAKAKALAAYCVEGGCNEDRAVKDFARAYALAKNKTAEQLNRFWIELFEDHGAKCAVALFQKRWPPVDEKTKQTVNEAYKAARDKFKSK